MKHVSPEKLASDRGAYGVEIELGTAKGASERIRLQMYYSSVIMSSDTVRAACKLYKPSHQLGPGIKGNQQSKRA